MSSFIQFTAAELVELKDTYQRFPLWIDANRIVAVSPRFHAETWGGRTYHRVDGTFLQLEGGEHAHVADDLESVIGRLAEVRS
jgi:hypothetical protein